MRVLAALAIVALVTAPLPARAQSASSEADRLFDEGRQLMEAGRAAEACPKFERSQQLDPGRGTLINIGACQEAIGHLVVALATYRDVAAQSTAAHDDARLAEANKRIASLVARIPHLSITLAAPAAGETVTVAGAAVPASQLGDVAVDPGAIAIVASAPGRDAYTTTITTNADGSHTPVALPALAVSKVATVIVPRVIHSERHRDRTRTIAGIAIGGAGAVAFGGSIVLALVAKRSYDNALRDHCHDAVDQCDPSGVDATRSARDRGNLATLVGAAGLAAVAGGVVLWLTAPFHDEHRTALVPQLASDGVGLALTGSF